MPTVDFYNDVFLKMSPSAQNGLIQSYKQNIWKYYSNADYNNWRLDAISWGTATDDDVIQWYNEIAANGGMKTTYALDGRTVLGRDYSSTISLSESTSSFQESVASANSNLGTATYGGVATGVADAPSTPNFNLDYVTHPEKTDGVYNMQMGAKQASGSMLATVADKASLAYVGATLGTKLGVGIDRLLYSVNPEWWDEHYPSINPDTWPTMATSEGGKTLIRTLFGVDEQGTPSTYLPANMLAQTYMLLRDMGAFAEGDAYADYDGPTNRFPNPLVTHIDTGSQFYEMHSSNERWDYIANSGTYFVNTGRSGGVVAYSSSSGATYQFIRTNTQTGEILETKSYVLNNPGLTFYDRIPFYYVGVAGITSSTVVDFPPVDTTSPEQIGTILFEGTITTPAPIDGITRLPSDRAPYGVPSPTVITGTTADEVLQQLKENYPDLFDDSITTTVLNDDGTTRTDEYIKVDNRQDVGLRDDEVTTPDDSQQANPQTAPQPFFRQTQRTTNQNPPDTGTGNQSPFVAPVGSASSLWAVYHPSQAQLNAFGAWLWSSDFVDQIKRLFNDPMQAIIGVHKVFAPIPTGGAQNIKCGFLDSGVSSPTVSSQYTEVNCGTVKCREYFGNVFDYDPFTKVSIYLPFIGVVPLKTSEVMRGSVNVTYGVDVITGACLAKVRINRDGGGAILYSYGGSCACHYPVSSGSYAGVISGIVTSAVGIAGSIATGNPLAAIGGAISGVSRMHTDVQHSGGFTGCAGAMGPKKPYLIITRPQTRLANDVELYKGKPSNATQLIGDCSGFVQAQDVHFSSQRAYDDEAKEVENLLKSGILIN